MSTITIPESIRQAFVGSAPAQICDENGNVLGYYTPHREATDEDYEWAFKNVTTQDIEASLASGPGRPLAEILAELRQIWPSSMRYTVVATAVADDQLAKIWLNAADRQRVSNAFDRLESLLKHSAPVTGRLHPSGWRVIADPPIIVTFQISEADRLVKILSVEYRP